MDVGPRFSPDSQNEQIAPSLMEKMHIFFNYLRDPFQLRQSIILSKFSGEASITVVDFSFKQGIM